MDRGAWQATVQSVQFSCSVLSDFATPWTAAWQASLSITNSRSLLKLMSIESVMPSNHLILYHPLLFLLSIFLSISTTTEACVPTTAWPRLFPVCLEPRAQQHPQDQFSSVQSLIHVRLFATPWTAACQASLSITNSRSLLKLMSIELLVPSNHLILCCPLLSLLSPSIFPSIRVFSNESVLRIGWPKYWSFSFSFSISPSNEYSGLISFRMDWLDLLAVQGTLKSLLQHHSSKASIL